MTETALITEPVRSTFEQIAFNAQLAASQTERMMASMGLVARDLEKLRSTLLQDANTLLERADMVTAMLDFIHGKAVEPETEEKVVNMTKRGLLSFGKKAA